jgi:hypothetical protein
MQPQTTITRGVLAGSTPRLTATIVTEDGIGFKPDTLTMSIYDVTVAADLAASLIVNSRNEVDVLANCDNGGNLALTLQTGDTAVTVPNGLVPSQIKRKVLFSWTWDTDKVGKHEIIIPIIPDRKTVAV